MKAVQILAFKLARASLWPMYLVLLAYSAGLAVAAQPGNSGFGSFDCGRDRGFLSRGAAIALVAVGWIQTTFESSRPVATSGRAHRPFPGLGGRLFATSRLHIRSRTDLT